MRIFLVGMCDIFLLLYLTGLSQVEQRPVSDLTVDDYVELQTSSDTLKKKSAEIAQQLRDKESEARAAAERAEKLAAQLEAAKKERENVHARATGLEKENSQLKQRDAEARALAADLERIRQEMDKTKAAAEQQRLAASQREQAAKKAEQEAEQARREAEEQRQAALRLAQEKQAIGATLAKESESRAQAEQSLASLSRQAADVAASLEEAKRQAEEKKRLAEEAEREAATARDEAERARQEALSARAAEIAAKKSETEALVAANEANQARREAVASAVSAAVSAVASKVDTHSAQAKAEKSAAQAKAAAQRLETVTQSTTNAFEDKIQNLITPVTVDIETAGLFGRGKEHLEFAGIPVRYDNKRVVFIPREQLELSSSVRGLYVRLGNGEARTLLVNERQPSLVGFVFDAPGPAASELPRAGALEKLYMPTLIAVRNGSALGFTDRLRRVGRHYFPFERDRLIRESANTLRFKAEGFRGTGDFAQYLVKGDQVVDLEGNLVGVVADDNRVYQLALSDWREVPLSALTSER